MPKPFSHQSALVYAMVLVSASDRDMSNAELRMIGDLVKTLPVFNGYDQKRLPKDAAACARVLNDKNGLRNALNILESNLPPKLKETAYALACDIAAADDAVRFEENRILELIRHQLKLEPLIAAAIERGTRARFIHP